MPSGKMHDKIAIISIIPIFIAGNHLFNSNLAQIYTFMLASIFSQLMFGPDLDTQSLQYKRWGVLKWIWFPYRIIFPHRSGFSHGILFGPILRFIYLFIVLSLIFFGTILFFTNVLDYKFIIHLLNHTNYAVSNVDISTLIPFLAPLCAGIFCGAAIHTFTDKIFSFFKGII
jgi:uncharacterized metal-binding protein